MERQRIVCPETTRPEDVDVERTPCGVVIAGCSRFHPSGAIACTRACAARLDDCDRRDVDDVAPRVLVVYAGGSAKTKAIATDLARHLSRDGLTVELSDAEGPAVPPADDHDAVVIGSCVHRGRHPRSVVAYVVQSSAKLAARPAFLFSTGEADRGAMYRTTGWQPHGTAVFPDRSRRRSLRELVGWLAERAPSATEQSFTEWFQVRDFALMIGEQVPTPELIPSLEPPRSPR